jgi:alpha-beta hydrolase superfamily lysophospholipase
MTEPTVTRTKVHFGSHGVDCAGYLYRPAKASGTLPCVVLGHGTAGTMDRLFVYAEPFAAAGMAVLLFDYRGWGASDGQPRQVIDIGGQLDDWRAAIGFARSLDGVDPERIALWGSSLSGGHVVALAADDPQIAAVVAQVPWFGDARTPRQVLRQLLQASTLKLVAPGSGTPSAVPGTARRTWCRSSASMARRRCSPARRSRRLWRPRAWRARCGETSSVPGSCSCCRATSRAGWWSSWQDGGAAGDAAAGVRGRP